jgi:hypothetical protein
MFLSNVTQKLCVIISLWCLPVYVWAEPVLFRWETVGTAVAYVVQVKIGNAAYVDVATVTLPEYTVTIPNDGILYCYRVRALDRANIRSGYIRTVCITEVPRPPSIKMGRVEQARKDVITALERARERVAALRARHDKDDVKHVSEVPEQKFADTPHAQWVMAQIKAARMSADLDHRKYEPFQKVYSTISSSILLRVNGNPRMIATKVEWENETME